MPDNEPTPSSRRSDRWSGRQTLLFIIVSSLVLWALIALIVHLLR